MHQQTGRWDTGTHESHTNAFREQRMSRTGTPQLAKRRNVREKTPIDRQLRRGTTPCIGGVDECDIARNARLCAAPRRDRWTQKKERQLQIGRHARIGGVDDDQLGGALPLAQQVAVRHAAILVDDVLVALHHPHDCPLLPHVPGQLHIVAALLHLPLRPLVAVHDPGGAHPRDVYSFWLCLGAMFFLRMCMHQTPAGVGASSRHRLGTMSRALL
jgi:hypothetical protein